MITVNAKIGRSNVQFNPNYYKQAYRHYQNGYHKDLIEMMKQATVDSHVAGCLVGRRSGFQREFSFTPYEDTAQDREKAAWMKSVFNSLGVRSLFNAIIEARLYKYVVIDFEDWIEKDGKHIPYKLKKFEQRYFKYVDGVLKIDNNTKPGLDIPPETLVCESDEMPILLPVLRDYILKDFGLESWAGFIETFGEGIILGSYPAGANQDIKDALQVAVDALARASRGIKPDNTDIEVKGYESGIGSHDKFIDASDKGISISILGHENSVSQSQGMQVGENTTSYKVKSDIAKDDLFYIDEQSQKLADIIYNRNYTDQRIPKFVTDKSEPVNVQQWADVLDTVYNHGVTILPENYSRLGIILDENQQPVTKQQSVF